MIGITAKNADALYSAPLISVTIVGKRTPIATNVMTKNKAKRANE
jgi:hypothetical protein